jgi:adenine-specific DNA-methyltransferase
MQKLELTWIDKGSEPAVEPRILLHDASKDYGDPSTENMLIHGDNLLALKALEQEYNAEQKSLKERIPKTVERIEKLQDSISNVTRFIR